MLKADYGFELTNELDFSLINERNTWASKFEEFMNSDSKYAIFSFSNMNERKACKNALRAFKKKNNIDITFGDYGPGIKVYVAKP